MIQNSLDTLPVVTFYRISETGNVGLLQNKVKRKNRLSDLDLQVLYLKLSDEFASKLQNIGPEAGENKDEQLFEMKKYATMELQQKGIKMAIEILRFEVDKNAIEYLKSVGISIKTDSTKNYYSSLTVAESRIHLIEANKNRIKSNSRYLNKMLEHKDPNSSFDIHNTLISFGLILNMQIDTNKVTCSDYLAYYTHVLQRIEQEKRKEGLNKQKQN